MLEVEMKFPVSDFAAVEARLRELGATADAPRRDEDHYFNAPDRDFARTDEALRLRRIGANNLITYKGPKRDAQTKTRTEIEIPLAPGDAPAEGFARIVKHLGYRPTAVVRKTRSIWHLKRGDFPVELCLDEADGVGRFVELEIVAPEESLAPARDALLALAAELGLGASERRSYLELLLEKTGAEKTTTPAVARTIAEVRAAVAEARRRGLTVGVVPTMGALHEGHISLIRAARKRCGFVVVTVFVNPTQFGPSEDLDRYPRPFERDVSVCAAEGVDVIFAPAPAEVYPDGFRTYVEVHEFQDVLCGASRPGHFRGVATVVLKLFNMVRPDLAFFGMKDAQQVRVIEQMVADLNVPVEIVRCPIVREPGGLALSSRNQYLDAEQRQRAAVIYQSLQEVQRRVAAGERDAAALTRLVRERVEAVPGMRVDYVAAVDFATLRPMADLAGTVLLAVAVHYGGTRLIDNVLLDF